MTSHAASQTTPTGRQSTIAILLLVVGAIAVAIMPNSAKLAFQGGSNPITVIAIRALTGVVLLGGYIVLSKGTIALPRHILPAVACTCISAALMNYTFYMALLYLDISLTTLIIFAHPLVIAYYFHFRGVSRLTMFRIFWGLAAFAGLGLALAVEFANISTIGLLLAAASGIFATIMVIAMTHASRAIGALSTSFHISFWSLLIFIAVIGLTGDLQLPITTLGWFSSIGNGVAYITAYITFLVAARLIGTSRASMLTFMEPLTTIMLAAMLFGERLSATQWYGVTLVAFGLLVMEAPRGTFRRLARARSQS